MWLFFISDWQWHSSETLAARIESTVQTHQHELFSPFLYCQNILNKNNLTIQWNLWVVKTGKTWEPLCVFFLISYLWLSQTALKSYPYHVTMRLFCLFAVSDIASEQKTVIVWLKNKNFPRCECVLNMTILKKYTESTLKPLLKLFIQDSINQKFHSCRENTFTKVIEK